MSFHSPSYWRPHSSCPRLFLAPMEGVADRLFRKAIAEIGGFDEACTEFIRISKGSNVKSLSRLYHSKETFPIPQAAQLMGDDPQMLAEATQALVERGAPRVDLNCGCPSNTVTGRGAGSSLLKDPEHLHRCVRAMVEAVHIPVTAKLRSGFNDTSLFQENLLAAQESGIQFLTLHPRTKKEGYSCPAHWELIYEAKRLLKIPVVGSGDIKTLQDALRMQKQTGCDGLMIGRGALVNPWIFHQIAADYQNQRNPASWEKSESFLRHFHALHLAANLPKKTHINKLKQLLRYLFQANENLMHRMKPLLRSALGDPGEFLEELLLQWRQGWMA